MHADELTLHYRRVNVNTSGLGKLSQYSDWLRAGRFGDRISDYVQVGRTDRRFKHKIMLCLQSLFFLT
jgi:hypothetical protein